ncbi:hypothetical protein M8C21_033400, partial [Ambrosia artemisiifolia]
RQQRRMQEAQEIEMEIIRHHRDKAPLKPLSGNGCTGTTTWGEKNVNYPIRPVDTNTDFEGTTSLQPAQQDRAQRHNLKEMDALWRSVASNL